MRTLQFIQTFMLIAIVIGVIENAGSSAKMEHSISDMSIEASRLSLQLQKLSEDHYALDKRVKTIEDMEKEKKKQ